MNKEQLEKLSDWEINKAVTMIANNLQGWELSESNICFYHCGIDGNGWVDFQVIDYCNNPSDMMPLVFEQGIELSPLFCGEWCASYIKKYEHEGDPIYEQDQQFSHNNPLRACAIVYLLIKG